MSSPVGFADRAMRSVSPILLAPGAQKEPSRFLLIFYFSFQTMPFRIGADSLTKFCMYV
jgi:hypothetical protein